MKEINKRVLHFPSDGVYGQLYITKADKAFSVDIDAWRDNNRISAGIASGDRIIPMASDEVAIFSLFCRTDWCTEHNHTGQSSRLVINILASSPGHGIDGIEIHERDFLGVLTPLVRLKSLRARLVNDSDIDRLLELTELRHLKLIYPKMSASSFARLSALPNLETIEIESPDLLDFTPKCLASLKEFPAFRQLRLRGNVHCLDKYLSELKQVSNMKVLNLANTYWSTVGYEQMLELHQVENLILGLSYNSISGNTYNLAGMEFMSQLKTLDLTQLLLFKESQNNLKKLRNLETLVVGIGSKIHTDHGDGEMTVRMGASFTQDFRPPVSYPTPLDIHSLLQMPALKTLIVRGVDTQGDEQLQAIEELKKIYQVDNLLINKADYTVCSGEVFQVSCIIRKA